MASECVGHTPLAGRFSDIDTKPGALLMPIEGYENMPLVSLEEAVEPLVLLVRDVRRRACIVKQRCENPPDNLSPDESAAIMLYTTEWESQSDSLYFILNSTLRTECRMKLKPWFLYLKLILTALGRLPPIGGRTVYRGIRLSMGDMYPQGKTFVWWGFSSCTTSIDVLEAEQFFGKTGSRTLFNIECNNGRCIRGHSYIEKENEVLLLPAVHLKVVACLTQSSDFHIIQLKEVDSLFNLLEPASSHCNPVVISSASKSPRKYLSVRNMSLFKVMMSSRKPEMYQNLKLEKTIAKCEPRALIDLDRQSLTDQDISMVVQQAMGSKQCTMLRLSDNKITSEGVSILTEALHNNTTLEGLYIFNNRVGDKGVCSFAQVLAENNSTLTTLSLGYNGITDEGAEYLAEVLKKNRTLSELWLPWNRISDRGVAMLADALMNHNTSLKKLSLDMNELVTDLSVTFLIDVIKQNQSLDTLHMRDCKLSKTGKAKLHEVAKSKKKFELNL
jgi:Ran GTPase-activating protein (RanGAP) involved in mRNA processing and transport